MLCWSLLMHDKPTNAKIRNWEGWRLLLCYFWNNRSTLCAVLHCWSFQLHCVWEWALGLFFSPDNLCLSVWFPLISWSSKTQGTQEFISAPLSQLGITLCQPLFDTLHSIRFSWPFFFFFTLWPFKIPCLMKGIYPKRHIYVNKTNGSVLVSWTCLQCIWSYLKRSGQ